MSLGMSKTEAAELYRMLNIILTERKKYISLVSNVMSFKISDFLWLRGEGIEILPSFKNDHDMTRWADRNGFDVKLHSLQGVAYLTGIRPVTESMFYIYCKKDYSSYRRVHVAALLKTLRQRYTTVSSLITLLNELKLILNGVISHESFKVSFYKRFQDFIVALDEKIITLRSKSDIIPSDNDFSLCLDFIDIDHVKCKASVAGNDWLLMLPCYPWVNRMMGRKIERKLKHNKLLMEGNFNYIELIKTLNYGMPQNMAELTTALDLVFEMYKCDESSYGNVESELKALFNF